MIIVQTKFLKNELTWKCVFSVPKYLFLANRRVFQSVQLLITNNNVPSWEKCLGTTDERYYRLYFRYRFSIIKKSFLQTRYENFCFGNRRDNMYTYVISYYLGHGWLYPISSKYDPKAQKWITHKRRSAIL